MNCERRSSLLELLFQEILKVKEVSEFQILLGLWSHGKERIIIDQSSGCWLLLEIF